VPVARGRRPAGDGRDARSGAAAGGGGAVTGRRRSAARPPAKAAPTANLSDRSDISLAHTENIFFFFHFFQEPFGHRAVLLGMSTDVSVLASPAASRVMPPLPDDPALLKQMILELLAALQEERHEREGLQQRLDQLLRRLYGPKAERFDPNQPWLLP